MKAPIRADHRLKPAAGRFSMPARSTEHAAPTLRIFLVEDHADTARAMTRYLQASGSTSNTRPMRARLVGFLSANEFDILLSDLVCGREWLGSCARPCPRADLQGDRDERTQHRGRPRAQQSRGVRRASRKTANPRRPRRRIRETDDRHRREVRLRLVISRAPGSSG